MADSQGLLSSSEDYGTAPLAVRPRSHGYEGRTAAMKASTAGKMAAARLARRLIHEGMHVALGTGSTVQALLPLLVDIPGVEFTPTSCATEDALHRHGLASAPVRASYDLYLDGADQVAPDGSVVKGSWGAHVRERMLAESSKLRVLLCDESKLVDVLSCPVPIAVLPFARHLYDEHLQACVDENGLCLAPYGVAGEAIDDPDEFDARVQSLPGVVSTGLFPNHLVDRILVGASDGRSFDHTLAPLEPRDPS